LVWGRIRIIRNLLSRATFPLKALAEEADDAPAASIAEAPWAPASLANTLKIIETSAGS